jgi:formylglycine-generating enzyme required for sulfatase activity
VAPAASAAPATCDPGCLSIEKCHAGKCVPSCPKGEVYVPATGPDGFTLGAKTDGAHEVVLSKPFCMDATEVTVKAYKECVDAEKCEPARIWGMWINYPKLPDHPVNKVHWHHGKTYCEWREQSLPTEAQWEWAATGGDGRKWAWGNETPTCEHADFTSGHLRGPSSDDGCHGGGTSPVGSLPKGDKEWPDGKIHDLSGNVWEWVLDNYRPWRKLRVEDEIDPLFLVSENNAHVVRGGGWNRSGVGIQTNFRGSAVADYQVPGLGFRCVRNPKEVSSSEESPPAASSAPAPPDRPSP